MPPPLSPATTAPTTTGAIGANPSSSRRPPPTGRANQRQVMEARRDAVLLSIDLPSFLAAHGVQVTKDGRRAHCWVHAQDRNPSVHLHPPGSRSGRQCWTYKCFGCPNRGDVFDAYQSLHGSNDWMQALEALERYAGISPPVPGQEQRPVLRVAHVTHAHLSPDRQHEAVCVFLDILDHLVPQAVGRASGYLQTRGVSSQVVDQVGGFRMVTANEWPTIHRVIAQSPDAPLLMAAGLATERRSGIGALWFDDVCMGTCSTRDGRAMYMWAKRTNPVFLPDMRYQNQSASAGASRIPYGLDSIRQAKNHDLPLRIVEGAITSLGSRSLRDGNALPTIATLGRIGWNNTQGNTGPSTAPGADLGVWEGLLPDFRSLPEVRVAPDNDQRGSSDPAKALTKHVDGLIMAENLVQWLIHHGVNACLEPMERLEDWTPIPVPYTKPLGYLLKDFADVAQSQRP